MHLIHNAHAPGSSLKILFLVFNRAHLDNGLNHEGGLVAGAGLEGPRLEGRVDDIIDGEGGGAVWRSRPVASTEIQRILHCSGKNTFKAACTLF